LRYLGWEGYPHMDVETSPKKALRKFRRNLGLTQVGLAQRAGISASKLSRWEARKSELTSDEQARLESALDLALAQRAEVIAGPLTSPDCKSFKQLRQMFGIGQAELARKAGLAQSTVSLFENGHVQLSEKDRLALEKAFDALEKAGNLGEKRGILLSSLLKPQTLLRPYDEDLAARKRIAESPTLLRDLLNIGKEEAAYKAATERLIECQERIIATQAELIELYKGEHGESSEEIARLEERNKLLIELLNVETDKGLATKKSEELREQVAASLGDESSDS
jgi:transcriptional regulator with XRE-family HTH domain